MKTNRPVFVKTAVMGRTVMAEYYYIFRGLYFFLCGLSIYVLWLLSIQVISVTSRNWKESQTQILHSIMETCTRQWNHHNLQTLTWFCLCLTRSKIQVLILITKLSCILFLFCFLFDAILANTDNYYFSVNTVISAYYFHA